MIPGPKDAKMLVTLYEHACLISVPAVSTSDYISMTYEPVGSLSVEKPFLERYMKENRRYAVTFR